MSITLRSSKGSPLTHPELDGNFSDLDTRTALGWRDNIVPLTVDPTSPNAPTWAAFRGGLKAWQFAPGELTEADSEFHIDHDYAMGTPLYLHVHWSTASTQVGTVRWGFEYTVAKGHQQEAFPETTTIYVEQVTTGTAYMHYVGEVSPANTIPGTGIEPDTVIKIRLFRDGGHANDTLDAAAFGIFLDLHYQADKATTPNKAPNFFGS
jgi:hypothetical protein